MSKSFLKKIILVSAGLIIIRLIYSAFVESVLSSGRPVTPLTRLIFEPYNFLNAVTGPFSRIIHVLFKRDLLASQFYVHNISVIRALIDMIGWAGLFYSIYRFSNRNRAS